MVECQEHSRKGSISLPMGLLLQYALSLALLAASFQCTAAIFEDQAREYSWHKQFVGKVTQAIFAPRGKDRVFVATDSSVIASVDVRSGDLQWRKVLDENDIVTDMGILHKPPSLVTLSRDGTRLRSWQATDGALLWDSAECLGEIPGPSSLLMLPDLDKDGQLDMAVACSGKLAVRDTGPLNTICQAVHFFKNIHVFLDAPS
jgi:hypothetical protein